jgi:lysyl-tRNA synthetase class 2
MPEFKIKNIISNNIKGYAYNEQSRVLRVWYLNGHVYDYQEVPKHIYESLNESPSKGAYINRIIKEFSFKKAE